MRVLRTAAGRRVLQLGLLVGTLFALGFLCGEQAHAADGPPVRGTLASAPETVTPARPGTPGTAGSEDPVRAVRAGGEKAVGSVLAGGERIVTPVRATGEKAVGSVRGVVSAVGAVSRSVVGEPTARPEVSSLPLPDLGRAVEVPVQVPQGANTPVAGPRHHDGAAVPARGTVSAAPHQRHAHAGAGTAATAPAPFDSYGPAVTPAPRTSAHTSAHHGTAAGHPGRPAPTGDPDGALGKQAVGGSASRHGDAHAVTFGNRAPLRLVLGAAARVDAPRTRERHRDIPVFPG
ncbi:hypothetical protein A6P39_018030 [Streptomyces sp. FXJ1.172]|uniref:hypothetical protein n=1 Tax=Streptomyces sp. FXJ1.172 TaxID=710705 RepID=UPI0013317ECD|nr:hypothetical protein [Streptomyces sp. FXJ1.172]WEO95779.1 hypothetical protein A6P39_018030 [Streptomyces sp. FXJ1.172]